MKVLTQIFALIFTISLLLTGCASTTPAYKSPAVDPALGPDPAEASLAEAARSVSHSLLSLQEMQEATTPLPPTFAPPTPDSYGMSNLVTIDWNGPIEPLLNQIADSTGYQVNILGKTPSLPILVTVVAKNKPIGEVLRDAGYQCGTKADIVIFPKTKVIELRYATE